MGGIGIAGKEMSAAVTAHVTSMELVIGNPNGLCDFGRALRQPFWH